MGGRAFTAGELAERAGARLVGDPGRVIIGLAPLDRAGPQDLSHLSSPRWRAHLAASGAGAVLVTERDAPAVTGTALVVLNPYLAYATLSRLFELRARVPCGVHESAELGPDVKCGEGVRIDAGVVVGARVSLGAGVELGAGCVIEPDVVIGADSRVLSRAVVCHGARLGARVVIHPGAVIGADGFGFARSDDGRSERIAQLGGVVLEDDVEVGANSTIDRGALDDTVIEAGVKIDNQVQIGHNVRIGRDTIICGCVGIAGSCRIGARCLLAGGVGVGGDGAITIADDSVVTGMTHVSRSIERAGVYSSGTLHGPSSAWKRNAVRFADLDALVRRVALLERSLQEAEDLRLGIPGDSAE